MATQQQAQTHVSQADAEQYYQHYLKYAQANPAQAAAAQAQVDYYKKWIDYHKNAQLKQQQQVQAIAALSEEDKAKIEEAKEEGKKVMQEVYETLQQTKQALVAEQKRQAEHTTFMQSAVTQRGSLDTFEQQLTDFSERLDQQAKDAETRVKAAEEAEKGFDELRTQAEELKTKLTAAEAAKEIAEAAAATTAGVSAALQRMQCFSLSSPVMRLTELRRRYSQMQWPTHVREVQVHWNKSSKIDVLSRPAISSTDAKVDASPEQVQDLDNFLPWGSFIREQQLPASARTDDGCFAVKLLIVSAGPGVEHPWKEMRVWGCRHNLPGSTKMSDVVPYGGFWDGAIDRGDPTDFATIKAVAKRYAKAQMGVDLDVKKIQRLFSVKFLTERGPLTVEYVLPSLPGDKLELPAVFKPPTPPAEGEEGKEEKEEEKEEEKKEEPKVCLLQPSSQPLHPEDFRGASEMRVAVTLFADRVLRLRHALLLRRTLEGMPDPPEGTRPGAAKRKREEDDKPEAPEGKVYGQMKKKVVRKEVVNMELLRALQFFDEDKDRRQESLDYHTLLSALISTDPQNVSIGQLNKLLWRVGLSPSVPVVPYRQLTTERTEQITWEASGLQDKDDRLC
eukprot:Hpha_TRINITY_DN15032_c7_g9::TRINITY_DN15032_c7_g9_i1::g.124295::m.124295